MIAGTTIKPLKSTHLQESIVTTEHPGEKEGRREREGGREIV